MMSPTPRRLGGQLAAAVVALLAACSAAVAAIGPARNIDPARVSFAAAGEHPVGYLHVSEVRAGVKPLGIHVWYPAQPGTVAAPIRYSVPNKGRALLGVPGRRVVNIGSAAANALPATSQGPFPVVVFSHGFGLSPTFYNTLVEHYASRGFVVLGPEHNEAMDPSFGGLWKALVDRPGDIHRTLDKAAALTAPGGRLQGLLDMSRVAAVGHSYGGYTALASGGARIDFGAHKTRCRRLRPRDWRQFFCGPILPREQHMARRSGLRRPPKVLWPSVRDTRVKAVITMAGDAYLFDRRGLAGVHIPVMSMGGTDDHGTPYEWGSRMTYDNLKGVQKALVTFRRAEHMIFGAPCAHVPWVERARKFKAALCQDPVWNKSTAQTLIKHFSTAFLLDTLDHDPSARAALQPSSPRFVGVGLETTASDPPAAP